MAKVDGKEQNITWFQYNNIAAIVVSAIMVAGTFWSLKADVRVLIERVDNLAKVLENQDAKLSSITENDKAQDLKLQSLEIRTGVSK